MNKRQYKMAVKVISADCKGRGKMVDCAGNTCAVGALAQAAMPPRAWSSFKNLNSGQAFGAFSYSFHKASNHIKKCFGLNRDDMEEIIGCNDGAATLKVRRRRVLKKLRSIARENYKLDV